MERITECYDLVFTDLADPRVKSYPFMDSPFPLLSILSFYFYFVYKLGPKLMKNRPPFQLKWLLVVYNASQIVVCLAFVMQGFRYKILTRYSLRCEPVDYSNAKFPVTMLNHFWMFFVLKLFDLLDTVFFVLRKRNRQISFLHVYHHAGMCLLTWIGTKYVAGGHGVLIGFVNCIVHMVMYFYYLLSIWDERYKNSIWWKKYVTRLQIMQFAIFTVYFGQILFQPNCAYPRWVVWAFLPNNMLVMLLFINYYINAYVKPRAKVYVNGNGNYSKLKNI